MYHNFAKLQKIYILFLILLLIFSYFFSIYVFYQTSDALDVKIFYYPSITKDDKYIAEVHNIPMNNNFSNVESQNADVEIFIEELFLGPQSIYLENTFLDLVSLDNVMYSSIGERKLVFIFLKSTENKVGLVLHEIHDWIRVNINNYFKNVKYFIFINGIHREKDLLS